MTRASDDNQRPEIDAARLDQIQRVFAEALQQPPERRSAFLDQACGDDAALREEVASLLAHERELSEAFLRPPEELCPEPAPRETPDVADPLIGRRIGRYRIKSLIAAGGMGHVYEAEQEQPRRIVALKIMRQRLASRSLLRRFQFEAQVLARLRHPHIAQVYEAGMYEIAGVRVPYFAMEFIPGAQTLTEYAEARRLGTTDRLRLFAKVCDAVHHGHQKGIIHRDIKPANILVDSAGEPKVIDFGIARATDADVTFATQQTHVGQLVGTMQYMSPEQFDADPHNLDTRTDVYSLGVVLYELLTGHLPYHASGTTVYQAAQVVKQQQPRRPSSLNAKLRGDVETVVLKALEKDRERRYPSAAALAEDIRRVVRHEPISARPPSAAYLLSRYVRRHRATAAALAGTLVLLIVALVTISFFAYRTEEARAQAALGEYNARIAAAEAALLGYNPHQATRVLDAIDPSLRGWEWYHMRRRADQAVAAYSAQTPLTSFAIDHHGRRALLMRKGTPAMLCDLAQGRVTADWPEPGVIVERAAFSPDDRFLVACGIWDEPQRLEPDSPEKPNRAGIAYLSVWELSPPADRPAAPAAGRRPPELIFRERLGKAATRHIRLAVAPDGDVFATGGDQCSVQLWSMPGSAGGQAASSAASSGVRPLVTLGHHARLIDKLAFSPDGRLLASCSDDHTAHLWDVARAMADLADPTRPAPAAGLPPSENPYELATLIGQQDHILSVAFDPGGSRLATASVDGTVWLWKIPPLEELRHGDQPLVIGRLTGHNGPVYDVTFDSTGRWLFSCGADHTVRVWDVRENRLVCDTERIHFSKRPSRRLVNTLRGHSRAVRGVHVLPDGRLATCSEDATLRVWEPFVEDVPRFFEHFSSVSDVTFSPDGRYVLSVGGDGALMAWDPHTMTPVARAWLRESEQTERVRAWQQAGESWVATTSGNESSSAVAAGGRVIIWRLSDRAGLERVWQFPPEIDPDVAFVGLAVSPETQRLAAGTHDGRVLVWDISGLPDAKRVRLLAQIDTFPDELIQGLVWLDPGGRWLLAACRVPVERRRATDLVPGPTIRLLDIQRRRCVSVPVLGGLREQMCSLAVSPRRDQVAAVTINGRLLVWELRWQRGAPVLGALSQTQDETAARRRGGLTYHPDPDAHRLLVGDSGGVIHIYDSTTLVELACLRGQLGPVSSLAFDPGGQRLVSGSVGAHGADNVVRLWEAVPRATGERAALLRLRSQARLARETVWQLCRDARAGPAQVRRWLEENDRRRVGLPEPVRRFALAHFDELLPEMQWLRMYGRAAATPLSMSPADRKEYIAWLEKAQQFAPENICNRALLAAARYQLAVATGDRALLRRALVDLEAGDAAAASCFPPEHASAALLYDALGERAKARQEMAQMNHCLEVRMSWGDIAYRLVVEQARALFPDGVEDEAGDASPPGGAGH